MQTTLNSYINCSIKSSNNHILGYMLGYFSENDKTYVVNDRNKTYELVCCTFDLSTNESYLRVR